MPLTLSVIIPTYNRAHLLRRALQSVLPQLDRGDQLIVVDDGSTDGTQGVVASFSDTRLVYVKQDRAGAGAARNRGVRKANCDLIAFLDSDDEWLPGKVTLQRKFMAARPDVLFCFTDLIHQFAGGLPLRRRWHTDPRGWDEILSEPVLYSAIAELPENVPDFRVYLGDLYRGEMQTNYLSTICVMIRRANLTHDIAFAESIATFEDWKFFGRLTRAGIGAYLDFDGAVQHGHRGTRLTDADLATCAECRLRVLKDVWGSDPDFLGAHQQEYDALVQTQVQLRIRGLLIAGRVREAREEISRSQNVPLMYRLLSHLHTSLLTELLAFRRACGTCLLSLDRRREG